MPNSTKPIKRPRVVVRTWGTESDSTSSGMLHYWDTELFGGNCGHVSIALELPLDYGIKIAKEIEEYCSKETDSRPPIIYGKRTDPVTGEQYVEIYFSWYPGKDLRKYWLMEHFEADRYMQHKGYDTLDKKNPHSRKAYVKGRMGYKAIQLAPTSSVVQPDQEKKITDYLHLLVELDRVNSDYDEIELTSQMFNISDDKLLKVSEAKRFYLQKILEGNVPVRLISKEIYDKNDCKELNALIDIKKQHIEIFREDLIQKEKECFIKVCEFLSDVTSYKDVLRKKEVFSGEPSDIMLRDLKSYLAVEEYRELQKLDRLTREMHPTQAAQNLSRSNFLKYKNSIIQKELSYVNELLGRYQKVENYVYSIKKRLYFMGVKEDASIFIPIGHSSMNALMMMREMRAIVNDESFHLKYTNCSEVVSRILAAGAPAKTQKAIVRQKGWGFFANPQKVRNAAIYLRKSLTSEASFLDWWYNCDFLKINSLLEFVIGGYIKAMKQDEQDDLDKLAAYKSELAERDKSVSAELTEAEKSASAHKSHKRISKNKVFAVAKCLPLVPVICILFVVKHLLMPTLFIKDCMSLLKWSFKNTFVPFKIIFPIVLVPAIVVHLIPALVENAVIGFAVAAMGIGHLSYKLGEKVASLFNNKVVPTEAEESSDIGSALGISDTQSQTEDLESCDVSLEGSTPNFHGAEKVENHFSLPKLTSYNLTLFNSMMKVGDSAAVRLGLLDEEHQDTERDKAEMRHRLATYFL